MFDYKKNLSNFTYIHSLREHFEFFAVKRHSYNKKSIQHGK